MHRTIRDEYPYDGSSLDESWLETYVEKLGAVWRIRPGVEVVSCRVYSDGCLEVKNFVEISPRLRPFRLYLSRNICESIRRYIYTLRDGLTQGWLVFEGGGCVSRIVERSRLLASPSSFSFPPSLPFHSIVLLAPFDPRLRLSFSTTRKGGRVRDSLFFFFKRRAIKLYSSGKKGSSNLPTKTLRIPRMYFVKVIRGRFSSTE